MSCNIRVEMGEQKFQLTFAQDGVQSSEDKKENYVSSTCACACVLSF